MREPTLLKQTPHTQLLLNLEETKTWASALPFSRVEGQPCDVIWNPLGISHSSINTRGKKFCTSNERFALAEHYTKAHSKVWVASNYLGVVTPHSSPSSGSIRIA